MNESLPLFADVLPCVHFHERMTLPHESAVYVVCSSRGEILYVGSTQNLYLRWKHHHRLSDLQAEEATSIAYYICPQSVLDDLESSMIQHFSPRLNGLWVPRRISHTKKPKRPISHRLSSEALRLLAKLADQSGVSQTAMLELMIREKAKKEGVS